MPQKAIVAYVTLCVLVLIQFAFASKNTLAPPYIDIITWHDETVPLNIGIGEAYTTHYAPSPGRIVQILFADTWLAGTKKIQALDSIRKQFSVAVDGNYKITFNGYTSGKVYIVSSSLVGNAKGGGDTRIEAMIGGVDNATIVYPLYNTERSLGEIVDDVKKTYDELNMIIKLQGTELAETIVNAMIDAFEAASVPEFQWSEEPFSLTTTVYLKAGISYYWDLSLISSVDSIAALNACNATGIKIEVDLEEIIATPLGISVKPQIDNFYAVPALVDQRASYFLGVEASDSDGQLTKAEFYRDTNGNGQLDVSVDQLVGLDTNYNMGFGHMGYANLTPGSYLYFARVQDNDGLWSDPSTTKLTVSSGASIPGNNFKITNYQWVDNNAVKGDHDGIMEAGERIRLGVRLESDVDAENIYTVLSTNDSYINITDSGANYDDFIAGQSQWPVSGFDMDLNFSYHRSSNFTLDVTYKVNGQKYYQELSFSNTFYTPGELEPVFEVADVTIDDSPTYNDNNNGDGIFQSGEEIRFRPEIKNTGNADVRDNVEVFLRSSDENVLYTEDEINYPDLSIGASAYPSSSEFKADANFSFAGTHPVDLRIEWADGERSAELSSAFSFTVQPEAWGIIIDNEFNFGLVAPGEIVTSTMTIENYGSTGMLVTGLEVTDGEGIEVFDTTTSVETVYISAGQSVDINIEIDTSALDGVVKRQIRFDSDGRIRRPEHARMTISGYVAFSDTVVHSVPSSGNATVADICNNWIVWNANSDIFAYNIQTGEAKQLTADVHDQRNPRISENIVVWEDSRNQVEGESNYDIYGYDLMKNEEFVVSSDSADEFLAGVDDGYVAFGRLYHSIDREGWWASHLYNLWLKDIGTGLSINLTGFVDLGSNPMRSVSRTWAAPDFGDGLLVWEEHEVYMISEKDEWRVRNTQVWKFKVGSDSVPVTAIPASSYAAGWSIYLAPSDSKFAWVGWEDDDDDRADSIWIWENGASNREIYEPAESLARFMFGIGGGYIVYDMRYTPGIFYWDISSNERSLLSTQNFVNYSMRMDSRSIVWKASDGLGGYSLYYAFINQPDIAIASADLSFSDDAPCEGDTIDVSILVRNLSEYNLTDDITIRLYDGDPDTGAAQLGIDQVIYGGLVGKGQHTVNFVGVAIPPGSGGFDDEMVQIHVRISVPGYDHPGNNTAIGYLTVYDNDTEGPLISNVVVEEHNGDGDGVIGTDERVRISWEISDLSGIGTIDLSVDGLPKSLDGNYYAVLDPLSAGPHNFSINATDTDVSPAASQLSRSFNVVNDEEITILYAGTSITDASAINVDGFPLGITDASIFFAIRNDGEQKLTLGDLVINVTQGDMTSSGPIASSLPSGSSTYFTIRPNTSGIGVFSGLISLTNSDNNENPFSFTMSGEIYEPLFGDADYSGIVDLRDAILALEVLTGIKPLYSVYKGADANGDGQIGLEEVVYILQKVSEIK